LGQVTGLWGQRRVPTAAGDSKRYPARDLVPKPHAPNPVALPELEVF
jgi:hypothetical protein